MKLINIDQTVFIQIVDESKGGITYEREMTLSEFFDECLPDFKPDIVDAIPIEWLKKQFYDNPGSLWADMCRTVYTGWKKTQNPLWEDEHD